MAADAPAKSGLGFLSQKVGPLPLGIWVVAGGGIFYYVSKRNKASATGANQQTDPAGNIGSIDPATGYVYGTPEDTAALAANNAGGGSGTGSSGTGTSAQTYPDNASWGRAAVNYLVGIGVDPTEANQAISLYLASQSLTTQQQADVNLAIQALQAPPSLPGPTGSNPPPVVKPPGGGGGGHHPPPPPPKPKPLSPKNLRVAANSGKGVQITWDLPGGVKNATWIVQNHQGGSTGPLADSFKTNNTIVNLGGALEKGGLQHRKKYTVRVREDVAGAPWGQVSYTAK